MYADMSAHMRTASCIEKYGYQLWLDANAEMIAEMVYSRDWIDNQCRYNKNLVWMFQNGFISADRCYAMML